MVASSDNGGLAVQRLQFRPFSGVISEHGRNVADHKKEALLCRFTTTKTKTKVMQAPV